LATSVHEARTGKLPVLQVAAIGAPIIRTVRKIASSTFLYEVHDLSFFWKAMKIPF
jgi:hypothetical protein